MGHRPADPPGRETRRDRDRPRAVRLGDARTRPRSRLRWVTHRCRRWPSVLSRSLGRCPSGGVNSLLQQSRSSAMRASPMDIHPVRRSPLTTRGRFVQPLEQIPDIASDRGTTPSLLAFLTRSPRRWFAIRYSRSTSMRAARSRHEDEHGGNRRRRLDRRGDRRGALQGPRPDRPGEHGERLPGVRSPPGDRRRPEVPGRSGRRPPRARSSSIGSPARSARWSG